MVFVLTGGNIKAQSFFTAANFPYNGLGIYYYNCGTSLMTDPLPGLGQIYLYDSLVYGSSNAYNYYNPVSTWCEPTFPVATITNDALNLYSYFRISNDTLYLIGNCAKDSSVGNYNALFSKPEVLYFKNMQFGTTYYDTAYLNYYPSSPYKIINTFEIFGSGNLYLPGINYPNTFVVKRHETHFSLSPAFQYYDGTSYYFFDSLSPHPLLSISRGFFYGDTNEVKSFRKYDISAVGLNEIQEKNLLVYPNPFSNEIVINHSVDELFFFDSQGKMVYSNTKFEAMNFVLETTSLPSGIYFLLMKIGNSSFRKKVVKK